MNADITVVLETACGTRDQVMIQAFYALQCASKAARRIYDELQNLLLRRVFLLCMPRPAQDLQAAIGRAESETRLRLIDIATVSREVTWRGMVVAFSGLASIPEWPAALARASSPALGRMAHMMRYP